MRRLTSFISPQDRLPSTPWLTSHRCERIFMETVRIIQRFRSLFYTPQFATLHLGVLAQEGLQAEVTTAGSGAEVGNALLRGEADLGLGGSIRTLELADRGSRDRLI